MQQGPLNETPEQKLTRLQIEEIEKQRASQKFVRTALLAIFVVPFVGMLLLAGCGAFLQAVAK